MQQQLGHAPGDPLLFERALTHRSQGRDHNERLEFLGDAVLSLVVAELLVHRFPDATEGELSRLRASLVSGAALGELALELGVDAQLRLGAGELQSGGNRRPSILAGALEALIGAIYLDGGIEAARATIVRILAERLAVLAGAGAPQDAKTRLQEWLQARGLGLPLYAVMEVAGAPHARRFRVRCSVPALGLAAEADGSSRRRAEQAAALALLADPRLLVRP
ncbi:MAG: ribonuclease III [Gammaproteobacteria bacterium]|nr:MAG: ribonuclease III [Gammaproteobacteria bacterium]